jgi:hypothetical protein
LFVQTGDESRVLIMLVGLRLLVHVGYWHERTGIRHGVQGVSEHALYAAGTQFL